MCALLRDVVTDGPNNTPLNTPLKLLTPTHTHPHTYQWHKLNTSPIVSINGNYKGTKQGMVGFRWTPISTWPGQSSITRHLD
jgi:hypothetical protein